MAELEMAKEDMPTYRRIEDRFNYLYKAINDLENTLDEFQGTSSKESADVQEKMRDTVANTWQSMAERLNAASEQIYKLTDRLRNMFH